jgi:hypothetical protein
MSLEKIKLNKENPEMEFKLNSEDSYLVIHSVFVKSQKDFENEWTNFLSKVKLTAELRYFIYGDTEGRFFDEIKKQWPIHFLPDPYQIRRVILLNSIIKNESFTLGISAEIKFYQTLKLELQDVENLDDDYTLEFNIEKINIDA